MAADAPKSKKQSDANCSSKQHDILVFFLDRSLGKKRIAEALQDAGVELHVHDDHFSPDEKDEVWLAEVGRRGWIVLTKDRKIRYRSSEMTALKKAEVGAFVLTAGDLQGGEMAQLFIKALPAMIRVVQRCPRPFIAKVTPGGAVSMLYASKAKKTKKRRQT